MKWQSEENVGLSEAAEWARHFGHLEADMDQCSPAPTCFGRSRPEKIASPLGLHGMQGRYVTGRELAEAGLAELIELKPLDVLRRQWRLALRRRFMQPASRVPPGDGLRV